MRPAVRPARSALLLLLLAGFLIIAALPSDAGTIRVAGVSLLWWYGAFVGPALAWLVAVVLYR